MLAFWLDRRRCRAAYETLLGDVYPAVRCTRRRHHDPPHRAPFGLEWR